MWWQTLGNDNGDNDISHGMHTMSMTVKMTIKHEVHDASMQPEERKNSLIEQEFASRRFPSLKLRQELVCWIWKPATHNNRVWEPQDATLYPRPTFLWTNNLDVKKKVMSLGARVVDSWQDATCHVVEAFSNPGQRVSWSAKLNGHLIVTKDLAAGPWIQWLDWYLSGPCCATTPWTVSLYFRQKNRKE